MIKRTLYFGNEAYLSTQNEQLLIRYPNDEKPEARVPIEDIGVVILDHYRLSWSQSLVSKLLNNNAALIICDEKHLPQGLMLNLDGHHLQSQHFRHQIKASKPLRKNLWQQTIKAKIRNQAGLLLEEGIPAENMLHWAGKVGSGDPENLEGRAAAYYWRHIFSDIVDDFTRGRYAGEPNHLLNYGYAVLRAIIARNLVASGLLPTFGIHHRNKYNAYCLADDIMEPYRPYVDRVVLDMVRKYPDMEELTPELKRELLQIPVIDVEINGRYSPLMVGSQQTTASLYECLAGKSKKIKYPSFG